MKKYIGISVALMMLCSPVVLFAQTQPALQTDADPMGTTLSCANISQPLRYGMRDTMYSNDVMVLQDFLNANGYLSAAPTGFFGRATFRAVKLFQSKNGIVPSGYVGQNTITKIKAIDCSLIDPVAVDTSSPQSTYQPSLAAPAGISGASTSTVSALKLSDNQFLQNINSQFSPINFSTSTKPVNQSTSTSVPYYAKNYTN